MLITITNPKEVKKVFGVPKGKPSDHIDKKRIAKLVKAMKEGRIDTDGLDVERTKR